MASIRLDLPEPVGPVRAKRSAPSKSTSTVSRNAVKPSTSRRSGRIDAPRVAELVVQLPKQGQQPLVLYVLLGQVLGEKLVGRAPQPGGAGLGGGIGGTSRHLHGVGKELADLL